MWLCQHFLIEVTNRSFSLKDLGPIVHLRNTKKVILNQVASTCREKRWIQIIVVAICSELTQQWLILWIRSLFLCFNYSVNVYSVQWLKKIKIRNSPKIVMYKDWAVNMYNIPKTNFKRPSESLHNYCWIPLKKIIGKYVSMEAKHTQIRGGSKPVHCTSDAFYLFIYVLEGGRWNIGVQRKLKRPEVKALLRKAQPRKKR